MTRMVLGALATTVLLIVPATARGDSDLRVRGTVALKDLSAHVVTVRSKRHAVALRVPGSLAAIRVGQRVELRASTLRAQGRGSRVLARGVTIAASRPLVAPSSPQRDDDEVDDDEVEIKGELTSLSPLTVGSATQTVMCTVPAAAPLAGFAIGDFVEITCDRKSGVWVLRELEHEDDADDRAGRDDADDEDDNHSGTGDGDDDDDDDEDDH